MAVESHRLGAFACDKCVQGKAGSGADLVERRHVLSSGRINVTTVINVVATERALRT
jgi:hypothetical protein